MTRRAVVVRADPRSQSFREGNPWVTLVGNARKRVHVHSAPLLLRATHTMSGHLWEFHPSHAAALAHAIEQVYPKENR